MSVYSLKLSIISFLRFPRTRFLLRWSWRALLLIFILDLGYLIGIWPDWSLYAEGPVPAGSFIRSYQDQQTRNPDWPPLRWRPVPIENISRNMVRAIIVAEDARFYSHTGIDVEALKSAMEYNLSEKRFVYGGSTISQQTVKNMFLSPSRNPLRKWHEFVLTLGMEQRLSKKRILELYLNVAEFGRGVYGVEAAARHYWGTRASRLTTTQAIRLAASLPAPVNHNPDTSTRFFNERVTKISRYF